MDTNLLQLLVSAGLTLLILVVVLLLWRTAKLRTLLWWMGFALLPVAAYLMGLVPTLVKFGEDLATWWWLVSPGMPAMLVAGMAVAGLGIALMLISRVVPYRPRRKPQQDDAAAAGTTVPRTRPLYEPTTATSQATPSEPV